MNDAEELHRLNVELVVKREELIAECMARAGFEYIPDITSTNGIVSVDSVASFENRDWVMQYGYGIVSRHYAAVLAAREGIDPNQEYLDGLTDAERQAFEIALWGPADNVLPMGEVTREQFVAWTENQGCWGPAQLAAQEGNRNFLRETDEFRPLFDAHNEMWNEIAAHPESGLVVQDWANCMANAGFPGFTALSEARVSILFEEAMLRIMSDDAEPSPMRTELSEREITLALADFDCRESTDMQQRQNATSYVIETQFVNDHRIALEAYRAANEQRS